MITPMKALYRKKAVLGSGEWGVGSGFYIGRITLIIIGDELITRTYSLLPTPHSL
jgi:hypothetical protein